MKRLLFTFFCICLLSVFSLKGQVVIEADHPDIIYWGRVDFTSAKAPSFEFPGVTIRAKFTGTSLSAKIQDFAVHGATTTNYFYKIVDGGTPEKFEALSGSNTYTIATGLTSGSHTVEIIKLTEAAVGKAAFQGFILDAGASLQPFTNEPTCEIEFIGNSITCGYGNEVSIPDTGNPGTGFHSLNENNYKAWGYVAARSLGMRYRAVCYSGRGLYRNNSGTTSGTLPDIYDGIYPDKTSSVTWDHAAHHPNYIVIDLGTNDFYPDPASPVNQATFESTYVSFVKRLKGYHPDATIILAVGVMMSDYYPVGAQQWTRIRTYVKNAVNTLGSDGVSGVYYFEMDPQTQPYGEDYHPTIATHARMASSLTTFINGLNIPCTSSESGFNYSIPNWLDNKKAAVALTFDDWSAGHPAIVVPELKKRNINATFFVSQALGIPNWTQVQNASADGNEIANHTFKHLDLTTLSAAEKKTEIRDAKYFFSSKIGGKHLISFAYPFGTYNQEVIDSIRNSNHIGSRSVQPSSGNYTYNFAPTDNDYYKILTYGMDNTISLSQFYGQIQNTINGGGLLTYLYHSIYSNTVTDNSYAQIHQDVLAKQLDTLISKKDQVWICTFGQAIQYHREKKTAVLTETSAPFADGNTWKLNLSDQLPDSLYFQALTMKVKIPATVTNILSVIQNGNQLKFSISPGYLNFNAVPDGGEIIINISSCAVPSVTLHPASTASFCVPQIVTLSADNAEGNSYEWYKDGAPISGSNSASIEVSTAGTYTVKITNNECSVFSENLGKKIVVSNTGNCGEPEANFKIDRNIGIKLQTLTLTDLSKNVEENATYTWLFGEEVIFSNGTKGTSFTGKGPVSFKFQTSGSKTISLVVSGSVKNDTASQTINILEEAGCIMNEPFDTDKALPLIGGWNNYSFSVANSNLQVNVPATEPNEWYAFDAYFNTDYIKQTVDFSDITKKPVIKFRAKASDTLTLKISLIDEAGVVADGLTLAAKNLFDVTTEYKEFELNVQGLFFNQWDEMDLDSTKIAGIDIRINSGYESYPFTNSYGQNVDHPFVGTLEIDWIGVNDHCTAPEIASVNPVTKDLQEIILFPNPVNNVLYLNNYNEGQEWTIVGSTGKTMMTGYDRIANVSNLSSGLYFMKIGNKVYKFMKL